MDDARNFPFLKDILESNEGATMYVLCDADLRWRDPMSLWAAGKFFAHRGIDVRIRPMIARHRRLWDANEMAVAIRESDVEQAVAKILGSDETVGARVYSLFCYIDKVQRDINLKRRQMQDQSVERPLLESRGPVILLGRPGLYPEALVREIVDELTEAGLVPPRRGIRSAVTDIEDISGRFRCLGDDPSDYEGYRTLKDTYSGMTFNCKHSQLEDDPGHEYRDLAVLRLMAGASRNRVFLFVWGISAAGTLAAAQALVDPFHNEQFAGRDVRGFFEEHGFTEALLEFKRSTRLNIPWVPESEPRTIRIMCGPTPIVSEEALSWMSAFTSGVFPEEGLYERSNGVGENRVFTVKSVHPGPYVLETGRGRPPRGTDGGSRESLLATRMTGGEKIGTIVAKLCSLASDLRTRAILLVGGTGVGKELASQTVFQERAMGLVRLLNEREGKLRSSVPWARFVAVNCAAITSTLAESQMFGIWGKTASDVNAGNGAILDAGEGVVLWDEIESMPLDMQAKLLRVLQPPYSVTPVGRTTRIPSAALFVAATNEDPESLVSSGRLRPDLYARLRTHTIHIPSLHERPGDIPALLASLADLPVRLSDDALRCLLAYHHPRNVRGLYESLARARVTDHALTIGLSQLEPGIRNAFSMGQAEDAEAGQGGESYIEIRLDHRPPLPFEVFHDAVELLSSVNVVNGDVKPRQPAVTLPRWEARIGGGGKEVFWKNWYELAEGAVADSSPGRKANILSALGILCKSRFDGSSTAILCGRNNDELTAEEYGECAGIGKSTYSSCRTEV